MDVGVRLWGYAAQGLWPAPLGGCVVLGVGVGCCLGLDQGYTAALLPYVVSDNSHFFFLFRAQPDLKHL